MDFYYFHRLSKETYTILPILLVVACPWIQWMWSSVINEVIRWYRLVHLYTLLLMTLPTYTYVDVMYMYVCISSVYWPFTIVQLAWHMLITPLRGPTLPMMSSVDFKRNDIHLHFHKLCLNRLIPTDYILYLIKQPFHVINHIQIVIMAYYLYWLTLFFSSQRSQKLRVAQFV